MAHKIALASLQCEENALRSEFLPLIRRIIGYWLNRAFERTQTIAEDENET